MKLSRITLALGILLIGIAISYSASATRAEGSSNLAADKSASGESAQSPNNLRPCAPKSALESALFATEGPENFPNLEPLRMTGFAKAAKLECQPCCNAGYAVFSACQQSGKGICECIQRGYNECLGGGCGPCVCCANYFVAAEMNNCSLNNRKEGR